LVGTIEPRLQRAEIERAGRKPTESLEEVEAGAAYIDRALALNPNSAPSWNASGWVRMHLGESASAIEHFERAMRLSPLDPLTYFASTGIGFALAFAGRYDEAISWATKALHEQPNWPAALRVAAMANALADRMVEAPAAMASLARGRSRVEAQQS
jgi:tetratricopeptide (TPR) repeat protein